MKKKKLLLWIILIIVLIAIARFGISSWRKYQIWESHQSYFEQNQEDRKIELWMTPSFVFRQYNIKLDSIRPSFWEKREPLSDICKNHQIDCNKLLKNLNSKILGK